MPSDADTPPEGSAPPPPVPPPLPTPTPTPGGGEPDALPAAAEARRLHPSSLVFTVWNAVSRLIVPALILLLLQRETFLGFFLVIFVLIPLAVGTVRYFTFTYRIEHGELVTRQGILNRTERNIPLSRVQDVRIEQGILHRLLHMVDVHVDTAAGGQGTEASLSVLTRREADRFRAEVVAFKGNRSRVDAASPDVPPPLPQELRRVTTRDLVLAGLTSNHLASTAAILAVVWGLADDFFTQETIERWVQSFIQQAERWTSADLTAHWILFAGAALLALAIGMVVSVAGTILLFHGFTVSKVGSDLHRTYGLLTRRSSTLPLRRIQVLKVEEKPLRRLFHLATLRADTAGGVQEGGGESKSGRDVLLPIVHRGEVERLMPAFFSDFDPNTGVWKPVSRRAVWRGTMKGALVCLLLAGANVMLDPLWPSLWPALLILPVYLLNLLSYRHLGYWLGRGYVRTRRGWLSRAGHVVPIRNIQSVVIRQTPFDRRHKVGTLQVDSAGQVFTGGGPQVNNIHWENLNRLGWVLAKEAARTRYTW